ncbi:DNA-binding protein, partial [Burkholderia sp. Cy-647]|nr:DNA-binding protein [Burkholderia sp. Cy-647]
AERGGARVRAMPGITSSEDELPARRKKPVASPSAPAAKEARPAHPAAKKKGGPASKSPAKKARPRKKY